MFVIALTLAFGAAARAQLAGPWQNWQSPLQADDTLVGRIWSARGKRFISPDLLAADLAGAKYVLIGETHDNADHHRLQAWLIDQIVKGRKPAVIMEMISLDQSKKLETYMARPDADAAGLGPALGWAASGWPEWPLYRPIAEAVFRAGLRLLPGNPHRAMTRKIASTGLGAIDRAERKRLALDARLPPDLDKALIREIEEAHCNLLPAAMIGPMTQVQRYRDAVLAGALIKAGGRGGAILITGNGHARSDRGVPWYLRHRDGRAKISTVLLVEITEDAKSIGDLVVTGPDGRPAADYFWITPRAEREDQCKKLRQRFKK